MGWAKPFDDKEIAFVKEKYPRMSAAEIAEKLGRSRRGVENLVKRLGLTASCAPARVRVVPLPNKPAGRASSEADGQDELSDLRELRSILKHSLSDAGSKELPKLSAEYREVLARISELERKGKGSGSAKGGADGSIKAFSGLRTS